MSIKKIKDRWNAETPKVFKVIRNVFVSLSTMAIAAQAAVTAAGIEIGTFWTKVFAYTIGISAALAALSQLTQKNDNGKE